MNSSNPSRRTFLGASALAAAGLALLPRRVLGADAPVIVTQRLETIRLGFIGVGRQAMGLMNNLSKVPGVEVVAGADVYAIKRERFDRRVRKAYAEQNRPTPSVKLYADYRELLASPEVDAVVIASPDHWHALMAIHACQARKDIYLEKPLTLTIREGQELVRAVRSYGVVLAVGSMQRSAINFQHAAAMVQKGALGRISEVLVHVGANPHPKPFDLTPQEVPAGLDWAAWNGPLPRIPFHDDLNPAITLDPEQNEKIWGAWRWYKETGGGYMTDWGAHMIDIAQWGLSMDRQGPVQITPTAAEKPLTYRYAGGVEMKIAPFDEGRQGVKFIGEKGWIKVSRGQYDTSRPELGLEKRPEHFVFTPHYVDFIESIRRRKDPIVPVETGHSTCTSCTLGNIAHELGRPLKWDPIGQTFVGDPEANGRLHYAYQNGYSLV